MDGVQGGIYSGFPSTRIFERQGDSRRLEELNAHCGSYERKADPSLFSRPSLDKIIYLRHVCHCCPR